MTLINSRPDIWNICSVEASVWMCALPMSSPCQQWIQNTLAFTHHSELKRRRGEEGGGERERERESDKVTQETCGSGAGTLQETDGWIMDACGSNERRFQPEAADVRERRERKTEQETEQSTARAPILGICCSYLKIGMQRFVFAWAEKKKMLLFLQWERCDIFHESSSHVCPPHLQKRRPRNVLL